MSIPYPAAYPAPRVRAAWNWKRNGYPSAKQLYEMTDEEYADFVQWDAQQRAADRNERALLRWRNFTVDRA